MSFVDKVNQLAYVFTLQLIDYTCTNEDINYGFSPRIKDTSLQFGNDTFSTVGTKNMVTFSTVILYFYAISLKSFFCNINRLFIFYLATHNDYIYVHLLNRCITLPIVQ